MTTTSVAWRWSKSLISAAFILMVAASLTIGLRPLPQMIPPYQTGNANPWNHRLHCRVGLPDIPESRTDRYLWIKTIDGKAPWYLFATDASFLAPEFDLRKDWYGQTHTHWQKAESGNGAYICLDYVSVDSDHKKRAEPYCAMSVNMGTLEFQTRTGKKLRTIGLCEVLPRIEG